MRDLHECTGFSWVRWAAWLFLLAGCAMDVEGQVPEVGVTSAAMKDESEMGVCQGGYHDDGMGWCVLDNAGGGDPGPSNGPGVFQAGGGSSSGEWNWPACKQRVNECFDNCRALFDPELGKCGWACGVDHQGDEVGRLTCARECSIGQLTCFQNCKVLLNACPKP